MRPQDNFNIITGQVKRPLPLNSTSKRFASLDLIKNQKIAGGYNYNLPQQQKLGHTKDQKMFVYTYTDTDPIKNIYTTQKNNNNTKTLLQQSSQLAATTHNNFPQTKSSLVNATKLEYNIISNTYQPGNDVLNRNWNQTKRKNPVSKFTHQGRTYAPNYTEGYDQKVNQKYTEFSRKRNLCSDICQIQKTYGTEKFFRKFK